MRSPHRLPLPVLRKVAREAPFELLASRELERVDAQRIAAGLDARFAPFAIDLPADLGDVHGASAADLELRHFRRARLDGSLSALADDRPGRRLFRVDRGMVFPQCPYLAKDLRR